MFDAQPDLLTVAAEAPVPLSKRAAIKAVGGQAYADLLERERASRARFRQCHPEGVRYARRCRKRPFKSELVRRARMRGRKAGLAATITVSDLVWPSHCPVLGLALDYPERAGERGNQHAQPNWPSLDRWDSSKGYVPGNVFVISYRANTLKNSATYAEILKVAKYLAKRP